MGVTSREAKRYTGTFARLIFRYPQFPHAESMDLPMCWVKAVDEGWIVFEVNNRMSSTPLKYLVYMEPTFEGEGKRLLPEYLFGEE